jgi:RNA polymerase sigma factor (sigma-70 family)
VASSRGWRRSRSGRRSTSNGPKGVRVADPIESAPPADPALVTAPHSTDAVYDVWEVRRAIAELPPDEREIVRLQHLDGFTQSQIAERLGLPAGTVKSRSFRAHQRLAAALGHLRE